MLKEDRVFDCHQKISLESLQETFFIEHLGATASVSSFP